MQVVVIGLVLVILLVIAVWALIVSIAAFVGVHKLEKQAEELRSKRLGILRAEVTSAIREATTVDQLNTLVNEFLSEARLYGFTYQDFDSQMQTLYGKRDGIVTAERLAAAKEA